MTVDSDCLFSQWRRTTRARQAATGTPTRKSASEASPAKGTPKSAAPAVMSTRQPTSAEESESDDEPMRPAPKVRRAADTAAEGPKAKKQKAKKQGK